MQVSELNSSATADPPSIEPESQIGLDPDPDHGPQPSEADNQVIEPSPNPSDIQTTCTAIATTPALHGTTSSHVDSPHPTQVQDQADQALGITATTEGQGGQIRRLSISSPKMLFSDLYKSKKSPLVRWRQHHSHPTPATTDYDPDLVSRDKTKQKEAIKRVLAEKVRTDWHFEWPSPSAKPDSGAVGTRAQVKTKEDDLDEERSGSDSENDAASVYSTVSEDLAHFRPRTEWLSDMPDDSEADDPPDSPSAYRFDTPDAVGTSVKSAVLAKSAKRRKAVRDEMEWNDGLACFNARRDAWTGAKAARVRPKPVSPTTTSPTTKRLSFWGHLAHSPSPSSPTESGVTSPLSPSGTRTSGDTTVVASSDAEFKETKSKDTSTFPVETLVPIPQPLLPPTTPMRASITPAAYLTIYDKIVLQSATPSCPVNLNDVVRSCVTGWKRDGEWPPRATEPPPVVAVRKKKKKDSADSRAHASRRMSFNFLGRRQSAGGDPSNLAATTSHIEKEDTGLGGKAIRKSLQRVLGLGPERTTSSQGGLVPR